MAVFIYFLPRASYTTKTDTTGQVLVRELLEPECVVLVHRAVFRLPRTCWRLIPIGDFVDAAPLDRLQRRDHLLFGELAFARRSSSVNALAEE